MTDKYCVDYVYRHDISDIYNDEISVSDDELLELENCENKEVETFNNRGITPVQNQLTSFNETEDLFPIAPGSPRALGVEYTQGYLRTIIGKRVTVTFLLGTSSLTDRSGILTQVGISYIILRQTQTNTDVLCDLYSIKFVNIFD